MDALVERLIADDGLIAGAAAGLAAADVAAVVEQLKAEADRHWWINPNRSLELADLIVQIGRARGDSEHIAMGLMARGDALKYLQRIDEAWQTLAAAGDLFRSIGDEVGWARTRIGRLMICVDLQRVDEALADAAAAHAIFSAAGALGRRLVLDMNTAIVHHLLGDYQRSLALYRAALDTAEASPAIGDAWRGPIHTNLGYVYDLLGDFRRAVQHYGQARQLYEARHEVSGVALVDFNSAHVAMAQGHYRHALNLLHRARNFYVAEELTLDAAQVDCDRVECYLLLNRFAEARDLAQEVCRQYHAANSAYREALTLVHLATAEAELGGYAAAQAALDAAEAIFERLGATVWVATARLRRAKIAFQQGDLRAAEREARRAAASFLDGGRQVEHAEALLLQGQVALADRALDRAAAAGAAALRVARRCNVPPLRYSAHLHNGRVAAAAGRKVGALRSYQAAVATIARAQQGLTLTLRPGFLENKGQAMHALMDLHIGAGRADRAFQLLEHVKSQTLLSYIANRDHLRWPTDDAQAQTLLQELDRLRAEHHWLYQRAHGLPGDPDGPQPAVAPGQAQAQLGAAERRMRAISEQLYLLSESGDRSGPATLPALGDLQGCLADDELLLEFYTDGAQLYAFTLSRAELRFERLPIALAAVEPALEQLELNIHAALRVGPQAPLCRQLQRIALQILGQLYAGLLAPLAARLDRHRRLLIVPYGVLHYVPFHLLYSPAGYVIDRHEVVILPAAGLITRPPVRQPPGALVLVHSAGQQLPATLDEARSVQDCCGGTVFCDDAAVRGVLRARAAQVLHIAAHGEHRIDQPDLSYIRLADGPLYADDLLQHDLSYELVTLSACESGRGRVAAGDELIGLGRSLLYAGAGAMITSLWRVPDAITAALMGRLYQALRAGQSKALALRAAQLALLSTNPGLHPAFWGAFQLVGDARPLSGAAH